ncbi:MAG TPA: hypothetical protein VEX38_08135 [Fimbriimonadaceae bacterium]|nr:hypothetical protein [Fimbriimonadaceae bacterium]
MLALIAAVALTPVAYNFPVSKPVNYSVEIGFKGFIPVLGGNEGSADVKMQVQVKGLDPDDKGRPRTQSDLTDMKIVFNGATLPFGLDNVKQFFPRNTLVITPQGKIVETDAPAIDLPVRLPGFDAKRFPDITYLPIEFPEEGIEEGKAFTYSKAFGDSAVSYEVLPTSIKADTIDLTVKMSQTYTTFEDEAANVLKSDKDAVSRVETEVKGEGKAVFDRKLNLIRSGDVTADAVSTVFDLTAKTATKRKLKTTLKVRLEKK